MQKIVDLSTVPVFTDVSVYPVLTFITSGSPAESYRVSSLLPSEQQIGDPDITRYTPAQFPSDMLRLLPECIWGFLLSRHAPLLTKVIADARPLAEFGEINASTTAGEADAFGALISESNGSNAIKIVNTGTIDRFRSL